MDDKESVVDDKESVVDDKESVVDDKESVVDDKESVVDDKESVVDDKESVVDDKESVVDDKESVVDDKESVVDDKESVVDDKESVVDDKESVVDDKESVVDHIEPLHRQEIKPVTPKHSQNASVKKSTFNALVIGVIILVGVTAFLAGSYTSNQDSDQISAEELEEALAKLELRLLQNQLPKNQPQAAPAAAGGVPQTDPIRISIDDDPIIGDPNAAITIIEFSDFQCPFCARFNAQTLPPLMEEYIQQGKVKLVFRDFPIQSIHPNAVPASLAAECANEQGKFKEMHDVLFDNQRQWSDIDTADAVSIFNQYANSMQLDETAFSSCLNNGKYIEEINKDLRDGRSYGVSGTPGFFIGNDQVGYIEIKGAQPFESFKRVIDAQLGT